MPAPGTVREPMGEVLGRLAVLQEQAELYWNERMQSRRNRPGNGGGRKSEYSLRWGPAVVPSGAGSGVVGGRPV